MYYAVLIIIRWEIEYLESYSSFVSCELKYQARGGHACNSWENLWPPALSDSPVTQKMSKQSIQNTQIG